MKIVQPAYPPMQPGTQPPLDYPGYRSSAKRHPLRAPYPLPQGQSELTGPAFADRWNGPDAVDLTHFAGGEAQGQRIIVTGRVLDEAGRPVRGTLLEVWQANACGRYRHDGDRHDAPLDPHFQGSGQMVTDDDGRYRFLTIAPGAYPWRNHHNAWRPAHIHFSLFGRAFATRLITQMYFPGDPLMPIDPVLQSIPDTAAQARLVAALDLEVSQPEYALGYTWDIVLRGSGETPMENRA